MRLDDLSPALNHLLPLAGLHPYHHILSPQAPFYIVGLVIDFDAAFVIGAACVAAPINRWSAYG